LIKIKVAREAATENVARRSGAGSRTFGMILLKMKAAIAWRACDEGLKSVKRAQRHHQIHLSSSSIVLAA
jgi:hypothetical protein